MECPVILDTHFMGKRHGIGGKRDKFHIQTVFPWGIVFYGLVLVQLEGKIEVFRGKTIALNCSEAVFFHLDRVGRLWNGDLFQRRSPDVFTVPENTGVFRLGQDCDRKFLLWLYANPVSLHGTVACRVPGNGQGGHDVIGTENPLLHACGSNPFQIGNNAFLISQGKWRLAGCRRFRH